MTNRSSGTSPHPAAAPDVHKTPVVVGIDIGGTFTDFVLTGPDGLLRIHKRLTTSANPADGAVDGLEAVTIEAGRVHRFKSGSGLPIKTPVVDMIEIGARGGSVAATDAMGLLKVGPHSAGADSGPACYGRGGLEPTATDTCVLLEYFDPAYFLESTMRLDLDAVRTAHQPCHALARNAQAACKAHLGVHTRRAVCTATPHGRRGSPPAAPRPLRFRCHHPGGRDRHA